MNEESERNYDRFGCWFGSLSFTFASHPTAQWQMLQIVVWPTVLYIFSPPPKTDCNRRRIGVCIFISGLRKSEGPRARHTHTTVVVSAYRWTQLARTNKHEHRQTLFQRQSVAMENPPLTRCQTEKLDPGYETQFAQIIRFLSGSRWKCSIYKLKCTVISLGFLLM